MRVSQRPLNPGETQDVFGNVVTVHLSGDITIDVGSDPLTATPIANINAAIKPTGARVQVYWRNKDLGLTPDTGSICLFDGRGTTPSPLVPNGSATVRPKTISTTTSAGTGTASRPTTPPVPPTGTVNTAPQPAPIAAPAAIPAPFVPTPPVVVSPAVTLTDEELVEEATAFVAETVDPDDEELEQVTENDLSNAHRYRPNPDMLDQWTASERAVAAGHLPKTFLFVGPAGSGKTDGAAYLAAMSGLDYLKVDAASITDAEGWFGMRDAVSDPNTGASVTVYTPSDFVLHVQQPGCTYVDEITRTKHRNVLLPIVDGTRRVLNPLTGKVLQIHPQHRFIFGGNFGLAFAETFAVDIALLTRTLIIDFDYLKPEDESEVLAEATGIPKHQADALARFAADWRAKAKLMAKNGNADLDPVATRQLINAASQIAFGADIDMTAQAAFFRIISDEGDTMSLRQQVLGLWTGIRPLFDVVDPENMDEHGNPIN
jgi:MoxR-like ATPase